MNEASIERTARNKIEARGGYLFKLTFVRGIPDRLLITPNGKIAFLEFKRPGEGLERIQLYWQMVLKGMGFICLRVESVDEVITLFDELVNG